MTTPATRAVSIASYRRRAAAYRAEAKEARDAGSDQGADQLDEQAAVYEGAADELEVADATPADPAKPVRMTMGRVVEQLLEARGRGGAKTGAVTIGRSARGVVTWEITATADPYELEHLTASMDAAIEAHDRLAELYPDTEGK